MSLESRLKPTWDWVLNVMDATEAQLRFGASLTHSTDPSHPLHPLHLNSAPPQATSTGLSGLNVLGGGGAGSGAQSRTRLIDSSTSGSRSLLSGGGAGGGNAGPDNQRNFDRDTYAQSSRRDFLTYALSLMRSHSSEHRDSLPVLDITALRHIAYVVDGIVYYMRSGTDNDKSDSTSWTDADENENDDSEYEIQMNCDSESIDDELSNVSGSRHTFFQRSESTLCLGCPPPDSFSLAISESLPLADAPHLLHPNASREDLFGIPKQPDTLRPSNSNATTNNGGPPRMPSPLELPPTHLGMSSSNRMQQFYNNVSTSKDETGSDVTLQDEQHSMVDVSEERSEQKIKVEQMETAVAKPSTSQSAANQNLAGAGSSTSSPSLLSTKEQTPTRQAPEGYNIYMQLKKKTYFDFYENDKRTDTPQDLSTSKTNSGGNSNSSPITGEPPAAKVPKLELDNDVEMADTVENETRPASAFDVNQQGGSNETATIRPQIIVSPRKSSAFAKTLKSENINETAGSGESSNFASLAQQSESNSSASNASTASDTAGGQSASGSPSKSVISSSVIVRVGSSASLVSKDIFYSFLLNLTGCGYRID